MPISKVIKISRGRFFWLTFVLMSVAGFLLIGYQLKADSDGGHYYLKIRQKADSVLASVVDVNSGTRLRVDYKLLIGPNLNCLDDDLYQSGRLSKQTVNGSDFKYQLGLKHHGLSFCLQADDNRNQTSYRAGIIIDMQRPRLTVTKISNQQLNVLITSASIKRQDGYPVNKPGSDSDQSISYLFTNKDRPTPGLDHRLVVDANQPVEADQARFIIYADNLARAQRLQVTFTNAVGIKGQAKLVLDLQPPIITIDHDRTANKITISSNEPGSSYYYAQNLKPGWSCRQGRHNNQTEHFVYIKADSFVYDEVLANQHNSTCFKAVDQAGNVGYTLKIAGFLSSGYNITPDDEVVFRHSQETETITAGLSLSNADRGRYQAFDTAAEAEADCVSEGSTSIDTIFNTGRSSSSAGLTIRYNDFAGYRYYCFAVARKTGLPVLAVIEVIGSQGKPALTDPVTAGQLLDQFPQLPSIASLSYQQLQQLYLELLALARSWTR